MKPDSYVGMSSSTVLCNFIEITLPYGCSPVNLLHIFRTPFPKNTSGGLLLLNILHVPYILKLIPKDFRREKQQQLHEEQVTVLPILHVTNYQL